MEMKYPKINYRTSGILKKAGQAKIEYSDEIKEPIRIRDVIIIPQKDVEIYQLDENFTQLLILANPEEPNNKNNDYTTYDAWFGGMDEAPFLVKLIRDYWFRYWQKDNFYQEIKPEAILAFEEVYGTEKSKRQGDIFAYELPKELQEWKKIETIMMIAGQTSNIYKKFSLFHTRHSISGELAIHYFPCLIGQGQITAPDHEDLFLDKLHLIAQTRKLHDPKIAD